MIDFLNYPLKQYESGSLPIPDTDDYVFEFKNVSFKYPGTDAYVLKNMNLTKKSAFSEKTAAEKRP